MIAILSDIHANWEALLAVLEDAFQQRAAALYCLGDCVGYGADPAPCLDMMIDLQPALFLQGNHEAAVLTDAEGFTKSAARAVQWTREQLLAPPDDPLVQRRRLFLSGRPLTHKEDDLLFVHGSPRDPLNEYIYPARAKNPRELGVVFWLVPACCFMGHTHIPGVFTQDGHFFKPQEINDTYRMGAGKIMCNVGSVGQPRDGDKRACYVLLDGRTILFRRVEYDFKTTRRKVKAIRALDASLWK
jgi:diadenosine tetraphosphatase ApaH/serine/threonine PP2A family protein phosphatase